MSGSGVFSSFTSNGEQFVGRDAGPLGTGPAGGPTPGVPPAVPPALPQPAVEPDVAFSEADGLLVAQVSLRDGTLELQASEAEIDRTLSVLRTIEIVAGAVALLVTGLVLTRVVAVALRPLDRMTLLANRIRAGARGRRLRPTRPRTEIGRTATAFDEMLDSLETAEAAANQAQERMQRFLADASHDLRTPLAGIIAGSDALLRSDFDELDRAEREQRLVAIVRQARQASRLVDDLLVIARLDNPEQARPGVTVDLVEVVRQQLETVALRRPDVTVALGRPDVAVALRRPDVTVATQAAGDQLLVRADPDGLRRVISNLLDNAANASPPNGKVVVELGSDGARALARRDGGDVRCRNRADRVGGRFELTLPASIGGPPADPHLRHQATEAAGRLSVSGAPRS